MALDRLKFQLPVATYGVTLRVSVKAMVALARTSRATVKSNGSLGTGRKVFTLNT